MCASVAGSLSGILRCCSISSAYGCSESNDSPAAAVAIMVLLSCPTPLDFSARLADVSRFLHLRVHLTHAIERGREGKLRSVFRVVEIVQDFFDVLAVKDFRHEVCFLPLMGPIHPSPRACGKLHAPTAKRVSRDTLPCSYWVFLGDPVFLG